MIYGALEAGGTKMVCAAGDENGSITDRVSIPTETPDVTLPLLIDYFKDKKIDALGIGCFGPVNLNRSSSTYGFITSTPKTAWRNCNIAGAFKEALGVPVGFDTDVNAAVLGEVTWGCAKGLENVIYITVGTGVGAGVYAQGRLLHGMTHPEGGHILLPKHPKDTYRGSCPFHGGRCLEGLASGPAIEERWGKKGFELTDREEVWELEAFYISTALVNYILTLSPQKIILGGGIMHQEQLMPLIRKKVLSLINGYVSSPELKNIDDYIVLSGLHDNQGILGALKLGMDEKARSDRHHISSFT